MVDGFNFMVNLVLKVGALDTLPAGSFARHDFGVYVYAVYLEASMYSSLWAMTCCLIQGFMVCYPRGYRVRASRGVAWVVYELAERYTDSHCKDTHEKDPQ